MSGNEGPKPGAWRTWLVAAVAIAACGGIAATLLTTRPLQTVKTVPFSQFETKAAKGSISSAQIDPHASSVTGRLNDSSKVIKATYDPTYPIGSKLEALDVPYNVTNSHGGAGTWLVLAGVGAFVLLVLLFSKTRNSAKKAGADSPGRMMAAGEVAVTFNDVAGVDEVVEELKEIQEFLSDPERFRKLGASIPKGVLLFGPPGTGKTLLARAVAGEAGVPFFSISGSDFVEMYVGVGASRVRKLFETAKQQAPCVIFIDEIDAVGRKRSSSAQGGQEERENTLNQLLVEIDGFAPNDNVIVMAASNRSDILDPALTRPGRFDRQIIVDVPDRVGRRKILGVHSKGKPFGKDVDLDTVAAQTAGFCGADLANLVNESALLAARFHRTEIGAHDIDEATMRVMAGPQKTRVMSEREKLVTAAHEMGHAFVAHGLADAEPVHKVTIVGRGRALGLTVMLQEEDKLLRTRSELLAQMAVALGGRVAEEVMFGEITTGAANDLEKVNELAHAMVLKLGMSDNFSTRAFVADERLMVHSDTLSSRIDAEIDAFVDEAKAITRGIITDKLPQLQRMTDILIDQETINRDEFERLMEEPAVAEAEPEPVRDLADVPDDVALHVAGGDKKAA